MTLVDTYVERDTFGMYKDNGPGPSLMGANTLIGDHICNQQDEHLGDLKEIMLDMRTGRVAYAVMSRGGVFTIGEKLFAVPWNALHLDTENKRLILNMDKKRFEDAPGFDSNNWSALSDSAWNDSLHQYYQVPRL